jgi:hypothetical protein
VEQDRIGSVGGALLLQPLPSAIDLFSILIEQRKPFGLFAAREALPSLPGTFRIMPDVPQPSFP